MDFHDDPTVAGLFLSDAGGVGLNLQPGASCCINLELPWSTDTEFEELMAEAIAESSVSGVPSSSEPATVGQARESTVVSEHQDSSSLVNALSQLSISHTDNGGLRIEAPRSLAAPLARLFEDLAA